MCALCRLALVAALKRGSVHALALNNSPANCDRSGMNNQYWLSEHWRVTLGAPIFSSPAVWPTSNTRRKSAQLLDGAGCRELMSSYGSMAALAVAATVHGRITGLDTSRGHKVWQLDIGAEVFADPAVTVLPQRAPHATGAQASIPPVTQSNHHALHYATSRGKVVSINAETGCIITTWVIEGGPIAGPVATMIAGDAEQAGSDAVLVLHSTSGVTVLEFEQDCEDKSGRVVPGSCRRSGDGSCADASSATKQYMLQPIVPAHDGRQEACSTLSGPVPVFVDGHRLVIWGSRNNTVCVLPWPTS